MKLVLRELLRAVGIGLGVFILSLGVALLEGRPLDSDFLWTLFWANALFSGIIYFCNFFALYLLMDRYKRDVFTKKYMAFGLLVNIGASLVGIFIARAIVHMMVKREALDTFLKGEHPSHYITPLLISMGVGLLLYVAYYYRNYKEKQVKEQKIIAGSASARFDALKNQLDPHFLFNSLNVLTSLIEEDPYQAQKFTTSLSKVYRYVLEQKNKDLVTVEEELSFAQTYVRLLKMRFEDSIVFEIPEKVSSPEAKIVPLSLQLLLENVVKHNVVNAQRPLHIKVKEEDGMLVVSNNLQEKLGVSKGSGVGLQNIRQRYRIFTDRQVMIERTASCFTVSLPMLTEQISPVEAQKGYLEEKRFLKAKERVKALKEFYGNLTAYCIIIPALWWLNYRTTDFVWAVFPTLGWGFGVLMHGMEAYGYNPLWGKRWEERKIRELMEKDDL